MAAHPRRQPRRGLLRRPRRVPADDLAGPGEDRADVLDLGRPSRPQAGFTAYAASKGAVTNLTRQLAIDMASNGVTVNAIAPGAFHTNIADGFYDTQPEAVEALRALTPAGRIVPPEEIVGPAAFLASRASDHVTGHVLAVDGGYLAR